MSDLTGDTPDELVDRCVPFAHNLYVETTSQLTWRSAVVPVPAKGRVRVGGAPEVFGGGSPSDPRERAIAAMVTWCHEGDRPLWLIEGGPGAGKTRLAGEVADRLTAEGWPCGWARPGMAAYAAT